MQPEARKSSWQALLAAPKISPLFGSPFVDADTLQLDWLHVVDIGICLQFLGSIFRYFLSKFPGSIEEQTRELFKLMVDFYNSNDCQNRLDELKPSMVKDPKKPFPKLRAKAGEARELVPFSMLLIEALKENDIEQSMYQCAFHFNQCYTLLSNASFDAVALRDHGASFSALYVALHEYFDASGVHLFKITPTLHLFPTLTVGLLDFKEDVVLARWKQTLVPNHQVCLQCPTTKCPCSAQPPSVPVVPNHQVSLQCPTTKCPCSAQPPSVPAQPPSVPAVPNHQVSLQCPTTKCPCSAQPPSVPVVSLQCPTTKCPCSAQPPSVPVVPNHQVSLQCPTTKCPCSAQPPSVPAVPNHQVSL